MEQNLHFPRQLQKMRERHESASPVRWGQPNQATKQGRTRQLALMGRVLTAVLLIMFATPLSAQEKIKVSMTISDREVYLGDSLLYYVQIKGSDKPVEMDTSAVKDFKFTLQSAAPQNSQMITIINGQRSENIQRNYMLTYQVTPLRAGTLTIPPLSIVVEGQTYTAQEVTVRVKKPSENNDFKLRLSLSKTSCYVGEPVVLTVRWYIGAGKKVTGVNAFNVPILNNSQFGSVFSVRDTEKTPPPQSNEYVGLQIEGEEVIARYGQESVNGQSYTTLTFSKILVPKTPGTINVPQATLSFIGRDEAAQSVWDFFGSEERKYVIPSNSLSLNIRDLPQAGKPANFSGLIGQYTFDASASPTEVHVGDPITLTIKIGGDDYLADVKLPPLNTLGDFTQGYKLTPDNPAGKMVGSQKVFMHVLRAVSDKVQAIPPLELAYFDSRAGTYRAIKTPPLPLKVLPATNTSGQDAGGNSNEPIKQEVETSNEGIAANYEGLDVLASQDYSLASLVTNPLWISLLLLPCLAYLALFFLFRFGPLAETNAAQRTKRQISLQVQKSLEKLKTENTPAQAACDQMLDSARTYLGTKLGLQAAALTYRDLEPLLQAKGIGQEQLEQLKVLFKFCEASRYAGYTADDTKAIHLHIDQLQKMISDFERVLK